MRQTVLRKFAITASIVAFAALFSVGWSEQRGISLSVESAQARRLYVHPYHPYYYHYRADLSGVPWNAVRAYYAGGPWCVVGSTGVGYGTSVGYGTAGGLWGGSWGCYSGWADYAQRNGIGCTPGTLVKGGDGIDYICQ